MGITQQKLFRCTRFIQRLAQSRMNLNSLVKKYKEEHLESTGQILCVAGRISLLKELTSYTTGYLLNQD